MVAHDGGTRSRLALASHCSNSTSTPPPFPQKSCTKANPLYLSRANPTTREAGAPVLLHKVSPPRIRVSEKTPSRNCPKRGRSNASTVDLGSIRPPKRVEKGHFSGP